MIILFSALAAIIPMTSYLLVIWWLDKNDREPLRYILINFLWGAVGAVIIAALGSILLAKGISFFIRNRAPDPIIEAVLVAPLVEELTKGIFLLIMVNSRKFDNLTDGLVYGGAIGLGFGMTENFLYFVAFGSNIESWLFLVIVRSSFSAVMHCISTATFGAFLAIAKFSKPFSKSILPLIGITISIVIHFLWNLSVSFSFSALLGFIFLLFCITIFITVFFYSVSNENKLILRELMEEVQLDLIPAEHINIIGSGLKHKQGWIDESIRKKYLHFLTTLAFRKIQLRNSSENMKMFYQGEIELYRNNIRNLIKIPAGFIK